jgi:DNA (cytosine-5)-methyltransferase 1
MKSSSSRKPKAIDLFAGIGGFSLGFNQAGYKTIAAVENNPAASSTYRRNIKDVLVIEEDIQKLTANRLMKLAKIKKGELDILVGGPPCQGFSTANTKRSLKDPRSRLMWEFIRMVKGIQPQVFMIENVPGLFAYKDFFKLLLSSLEKKGYVVRFLMMDACSYGVPQTRKRIFIQGVRKDLDFLPIFPTPTHFDPKQIKKRKDMIFSLSSVAVKCFAINGFSKEEVNHLWWNTKLGIQMNKKTAPDVIDNAIRILIGEGIYRTLRDHKPKAG